jgi:hypothetical protein
MEDYMETLTFILGMALRIGIPVGVTAFLVWLFHCLDARWQNQAEQEGVPTGQNLAANLGCWNINQCSPEGRKTCKAFAHPEAPCWQVFRSGNGNLQEKCLKCRVFKEAPVPAAVWPAA